MQRTLTRHAPLFAIAAMTALYAYGVLSAPYVPQGFEPVVLPLDFMVGLPAIFYLCVVKPKGVTPLSVIPVIWLGYALSALALGSPQAGILPQLLAALFPLEALIAIREIRRIVSAFRLARGKSPDPMSWTRSLVRVVIRKDPVASLAATELSIWYYVLLSWGKEPLASAGEKTFSTYKESGYMTFMIVLCLVFPVEIVGVHLLVMQWSMAAAVAITLLSLYMAAWLAGDARAHVMRPIAVSREAVRIECGVQCSATIPVSSIRSVSRATGKEAPKRDDAMNIGAFYNANVWITADTPLAAHTPLGERRVRTIGFSVDDAGAFVREVQESLKGSS